MEVFVPSAEDLLKAHEVFETKESRWRDYWRASEGVEGGFKTGDIAEVAAAIAAFLKTWHRYYYSFRPPKLDSLPTDLQQLITKHAQTISAFRGRSLASLSLHDRSPVMRLFSAFAQILNEVGAAKALNVLAPNFFPLWDNPIAWAYGVSMTPQGYFLFMSVVKYQLSSITLSDELNPLKILDEHNYCKFTNNWLSEVTH